MKAFDREKFCRDLLLARGEKTQLCFAKELGINRSTLSLLESGNQTPSFELLNEVCVRTGNEPNDYFHEYQNDALVFLMGSLQESDQEKVTEMLERIRIKEKYEIIARRCRNGSNR